MAKTKRLEHVALFSLIMQVVFVGAAYVLCAVSGSLAVYAEMWHLAAGVLVWFVVLLHGRQRRLAREEEEERDELKATRISEEIFDQTELDTMRAGTSLFIFEKYFIPVFSILLSGLLIFLGYIVASKAWSAGVAAPIGRASAAAVGMVFVTFLGFLLGKYAAGLAQAEGYRLLRAAGGYLLGNVMASFLVTVALAAAHFSVFWPGVAVSYLIPIGMALVSLEVILNLILDIYRPRIVGKEARPPYDSRLLGLFAEPGGVLKTVADTLDYQFGFKVSETWFYRFMERAIVPLILIQLFTLWLLSCIVVVHQDEIAFIERFGRPKLSQEDASKGLKATVFEPGHWLKAPWPIGRAVHVPAYRLHRLELGRIHFSEEERPVEHIVVANLARDEDVILWDQEHVDPNLGYEVNFLVPGAQQVGEERTLEINLARILAFVHYRVKTGPDGRIDGAAAYNYRYRHADPAAQIENLSYSVVCRMASNQDFLKWVTVDRDDTARRLREDLQIVLDERDLGVDVVFVGIPVVHPPPATAEAYNSVINAYQQGEATVLAGRKSEVQIVEDSKAMAAQIVTGARSYGYNLSRQAEADAKRFLIQLSAYLKSPEVYRYRKYFSVAEELVRGHQFIIVPDVGSEVNIINLEKKHVPGLLDIEVEEAIHK